MSSIYRGAWATIVALDAKDVYSGIARTGYRPGSGPAAADLPTTQLVCTWEGQQLLSVQPTLSQQVTQSIWQTRAWTYQEAVISPRCLYFTKTQVYFECNTMQCCESIDESESSYHNFEAADRARMVNSCMCQSGTQNALGRGRRPNLLRFSLLLCQDKLLARCR